MEIIKDSDGKAVMVCSYLKEKFIPQNQKWLPWVIESNKL